MTSSLREVDDVDDGEETNECHRRYLKQNYKCAAGLRVLSCRHRLTSGNDVEAD